MIAAYPQVPTGYDLGINCAVESYDGKLFFGLVADAQVARDVKRLRDFLYVSFQELLAAAGKKAPAAAKQPRSRRRKAIRRGRSARRQPPKPAEAVAPAIPPPARKIPPATTPVESEPAGEIRQKLRQPARKKPRAAAQQPRARRKAIRQGRSARRQPSEPTEAVAPVIPRPAMKVLTATPAAPAGEINNAA
jgi:hypothetical protein